VVALETQQAMRAVQGLPFCYLCGNEFVAAGARNRDHVPPSSIFAIPDRNFPLVLPTHTACNGGWSAGDEAIAQLVGLLHGKPLPIPARLEFASGLFDDGTQGVAVRGLDLRAVIRRCVRGFHAALYREPLASTMAFATCPPMPEVRVEDAGAQYVEPPEMCERFVEELQRNRASRTVDRIVCRNGKCRYECVWSLAEDGRWLCIYGLDLYGWRELGDPDHFEPRSCVGAYRLPDARIPDAAGRATELVFSIGGGRRDPFGE